MANKKIIIALDVNNKAAALKLAKNLDPQLCRLKVGLELFTAEGCLMVEAIHKLGFEIFLDLKFHDIPNTVARACSVVASMGVWMVNVHALGGKAMMSAAREAISKSTHQPILTAVTILTSSSQDDLASAGISMDLHDCVLQLADNARQAGCDGVVCSALEAKAIRNKMGTDFMLVTPGIRPPGSIKNDQNRIVTPSEAINLGADHIVIGRPVTMDKNPANVLREIYNSL